MRLAGVSSETTSETRNFQFPAVSRSKRILKRCSLLNAHTSWMITNIQNDRNRSILDDCGLSETAMKRLFNFFDPLNQT